MKQQQLDMTKKDILRFSSQLFNYDLVNCATGNQLEVCVYKPCDVSMLDMSLLPRVGVTAYSNKRAFTDNPALNKLAGQFDNHCCSKVNGSSIVAALVSKHLIKYCDRQPCVDYMQQHFQEKLLDKVRGVDKYVCCCGKTTIDMRLGALTNTLYQQAGISFDRTFEFKIELLNEVCKLLKTGVTIHVQRVLELGGDIDNFNVNLVCGKCTTGARNKTQKKAVRAKHLHDVEEHLLKPITKGGSE